MARLTTKELSKRTWPDYRLFFSQGNGWDHCGCTAYQGVRSPRSIRRFADQRDYNLDAKCQLVNNGRAHGILVYDGAQPVGWCQFGPRSELPIRDEGGRTPPFPDGERIWRITCFCTMPSHRARGVAEHALRAAIDAIRTKGGGLIRAAPIVTLPADEEYEGKLRARGGQAEEVRRYLLAKTGATDLVYYDRRPIVALGMTVMGFEPVNALVRRGGGWLHQGSVALFARNGFKPTGILEARSRKFPISRLVMERTVRRAR